MHNKKNYKKSNMKMLEITEFTTHNHIKGIENILYFVLYFILVKTVV